MHPIAASFRSLRRKKLSLAIGLLVLMVSSVVTYYYLGYRSVSATILGLELDIFRTRGTNNMSIGFHIPALVWSSETLLDIRVSSPTFTLQADSFALGTANPTSGTVHSGHCLVFPLSFQMNDPAAATILSEKKSNSIVLTMNTIMSSGLYSQKVTKSVSNEVYDTPRFIDLYACTLDILSESSGI